jgi:hypothetical protein
MVAAARWALTAVEVDPRHSVEVVVGVLAALAVVAVGTPQLLAAAEATVVAVAVTDTGKLQV